MINVRIGDVIDTQMGGDGVFSLSMTLLDRRWTDNGCFLRNAHEGSEEVKR